MPNHEKPDPVLSNQTPMDTDDDGWKPALDGKWAQTSLDGLMNAGHVPAGSTAYTDVLQGLWHEDDPQFGMRSAAVNWHQDQVLRLPKIEDAPLNKVAMIEKQCSRAKAAAREECDLLRQRTAYALKKMGCPSVVRAYTAKKSTKCGCTTKRKVTKKAVSGCGCK